MIFSENRFPLSGSALVFGIGGGSRAPIAFLRQRAVLSAPGLRIKYSAACGGRIRRDVRPGADAAVVADGIGRSLVYCFELKSFLCVAPCRVTTGWSSDMSSSERMLIPACTCGRELFLARPALCQNVTHVRVYRCDSCGHETRIIVWGADIGEAYTPPVPTRAAPTP
jgi:hypothetical protein